MQPLRNAICPPAVACGPASLLPGRDDTCKLLERRNHLGWPIDPGFERFPVLGRNSDDGPIERVGFSCFNSLPAHEIAETGARLVGRRCKNSTLVGIDPNAENRGGRCWAGHGYNNSIRHGIFGPFPLLRYLSSV